MNKKLTKWAAAAVLSISAAAPALGGSVTRPGDTVGAAVGLPLPPGFYFAESTDPGFPGHKPAWHLSTWVDVPVLVWSTPWTIFGGRLVFSTAPVVPVSSHLRHGQQERPVQSVYGGSTGLGSRP